MAGLRMTVLYPFGALTTENLVQAGGKGSTLAHLYQRGYPVPDGFVILPAAFAGDDLKPEAWEQARACLARLRRNGGTSFAVRSSALSEDSAQASFAGEFETVLNVETDEAVCDAIGTVRRSRHNQRVRAYSQAQHLPEDHEVAVVVQRFVRAEFAGVLFTANPITGNLMQMTGNFVLGSGEKLVGGEANAQTFTFDRRNGKYSGPPELRRYARRLYRLGARLDTELGTSQDIEWVVAGGKVFVLQSRPITTMRGFNPLTGEWNDSLTGDFLWSNGNAAEIQPEVMPLLTTTIGQLWGQGYGLWWSRYPMSGTIGGRQYFNLSVQVAPFAKLPGVSVRRAMDYIELWWGRVPPDTTIPLLPVSLRQVITRILPDFLRSARAIVKYRPQIPGFVAETPQWCREMRPRIQQADSRVDLITLWQDQIKPYYCFGTTMASAGNANTIPHLEAKLRKLVGEADASALLSNLGGQSYLDSLGPLVCLAKVARGDMSRDDYLDRYGHRGPYEFDLIHPQPAEDPAWLDQQLALFDQMPVDVDALLDRQRAQFEAAWQRLSSRYPRKAKALRRQMDEAARLAHLREAARSEITRVMGVFRAWALRAGELTGLGEDVFHLTIDELLAVLGGNENACCTLPARKETYARYCALPPYPPVISGRFDPFQWADDPNRRQDVYDAHTSAPMPTPNGVTGFAGAAGVVEGIVRRIDHVEQGHLLESGEILVTSTTNVGWTLLFPRAAAIVTDVGAPLSHAAIVARELGIPAVVGCVNATIRLKTGDRVRVNGGQGTVEMLQPRVPS
jgi:phosphohistidine swiveling domain-containing protein